MFLCNFHADTPTKLYRSNLPFSHPALQAGAHAHLPFGAAFEVYAVYSERSESDEQAWNTCFRKLSRFRRAIGDCRLPVPLHLFAVEDGRILAGDIKRLETLYLAGIRFLVLVWQGESVIGGAYDTDVGLTDFGRETVRECFRLGIILDISHASDRLADEVLDMASAASRPVIASHSCFRALQQIPRNISDGLCHRVAESGGIIGISLYPPHLTDKEATIETVAEHIGHGLCIAPRSIVLGTDYDGIESTPVGLPVTAALVRLADRLLSLGFSEDTVRDVFYRNGIRFLKKNFPQFDTSQFNT